MMQSGFPEFVLHDCVFIELVKCKVSSTEIHLPEAEVALVLAYVSRLA